MKKLLLLSFGLFLTSYMANAQLFSENFESYNAGDLVGKGNWVANPKYAGVGIQVSASGINGNRAAYINPGGSSGDGPVVPFNNSNISLTTNGTGTIYVSFLVKFGALPTNSTNGSYFFYLADMGADPINTDGRGRLYAKLDPGASGKFAFGAIGSSNSANDITYTGFNYEIGKTYMIIEKYEKSASGVADKVSLWISNTTISGLETAPTVFNASESSISKKAISGIGFRTMESTYNIMIDDIKVDPTWAGVIGTNVPLPVTLTSFTGTPQNNSIRLNWTTASEQSNSHFDVLRSDDGKVFNILTTLTGKGTTQQTSNYTYTDANPFSGTNYYQLRQVDLDGKSELSKIIAIKAIPEETSLSVYASDTYTEVSNYSLVNQKATIRIYSIAGNQISEQTIDLAKGHNSIQIPLELQASVYVATLSTGSETISTKFISQ